MFTLKPFTYRPQGTNDTLRYDRINATNPCLTRGCLNNGSCVRVIETQAMIAEPTYVCRCPAFYDGPFCEHRIPKHACEPNPCIYAPLLECRLLDQGNYDCICPNNTDCLNLFKLTTEETTTATTKTTSTVETTTQSTTTTATTLTTTTFRTTRKLSVNLTTSKYASKGLHRKNVFNIILILV
jgi:hypothetical protein